MIATTRTASPRTSLPTERNPETSLAEAREKINAQLVPSTSVWEDYLLPWNEEGDRTMVLVHCYIARRDDSTYSVVVERLVQLGEFSDVRRLAVRDGLHSFDNAYLQAQTYELSRRKEEAF